MLDATAAAAHGFRYIGLGRAPAAPHAVLPTPLQPVRAAAERSSARTIPT